MNEPIGVRVIAVTVEPKPGRDRENLALGLRRLTAEDPTCRAEIADDRTGRAVISGVGELQLEIILDRLSREFHVEAAVSAPQVVYLNAGPVQLEPWMRLEVTVPSDHATAALATLAKRRSQGQSEEVRGDTRIFRARVPFAQMLGYANELRARTFGRATFSLKFDSYQPVDDGHGAGDDRAMVGAPLTPRPTSKTSSISLPEPDDDCAPA